MTIVKVTQTEGRGSIPMKLEEPEDCIITCMDLFSVSSPDVVILISNLKFVKKHSNKKGSNKPNPTQYTTKITKHFFDKQDSKRVLVLTN